MNGKKKNKNETSNQALYSITSYRYTDEIPNNTRVNLNVRSILAGYDKIQCTLAYMHIRSGRLIRDYEFFMIVATPTTT